MRYAAGAGLGKKSHVKKILVLRVERHVFFILAKTDVLVLKKGFGKKSLFSFFAFIGRYVRLTGSRVVSLDNCRTKHIDWYA